MKPPTEPNTCRTPCTACGKLHTVVVSNRLPRLCGGCHKSFYLAAPYRRRTELKRYAEELEAAGHTVTARWLSGSHDLLVDTTDEVETRGSWAAEDIEDICESDCIIAFTVPAEEYRRGGMHVELGIALALGKRVIEVGDNYSNVFYCLPGVEHFRTWEAAKAALMPKRASLAHSEGQQPAQGAEEAESYQAAAKTKRRGL